jgi:uncharacterized protein (TIGR00251 family)
VLIVEERDGVIRLKVRVSPRASRDVILGEHDGALKIAISAPPVDGEANAAVIAFLARALDLPKRAIAIIGGASSKQKLVEIRGVDAARVRGLIG